MRAVAVTAGLLALLALVAVGSRSEGWSSGEARDVSPLAVDLAYTLAILLALALLAVVVATIKGAKGKVTLDPPSGLGRLVFVMAALVLFLGYGMSRYEFQRQQPEENDDVFGTASTQTEVDDVREPRPVRDPEFQWWLAVAAAGGVAAVGIWWYRRSRLRPRPVARRETVAEQLTDVLTETLDDLRLERDARRAVIRAYARMEQVLASHGLPRKPHEAPLEYLARVLRELDVRAESAHALTELFERAKFSQHEIDVAMKEEAIAALGQVRDDLEAAA